MREVAGPIPRRHGLKGDILACQRLCFKLRGILRQRVCRKRMPLEIHLGGGQHLCQRMPAIKVLRPAQLGFQLRRHSCIRCMMTCVVGKDGGVTAPVFVELRWKLDEVTGDGCAGQARIGHVRKQAVQCVAELVKQRLHFVRGEQTRFALRRLGVVAHIADDRLRAKQSGLLHKTVHPSAAALGIAFIEVGVQQSQMGTVAVEDLIRAHIRMPHRQVATQLKTYAVELRCREKHSTLEDALQFEVRLHFLLVQVVLRLAHLLGVEVPIVWLQRAHLALLRHKSFDLMCLRCHAGMCRRHQPV